MSKYNSSKVETQEGVFDSKKEYKRWLYLKQLENSGMISGLIRQKKYELIPAQYRTVAGKRRCVERAIHFVADFVYIRDGEVVVEDVKGYRDPRHGAYAIFTIKRKLMLYIYNIRVEEV